MAIGLYDATPTFTGSDFTSRVAAAGEPVVVLANDGSRATIYWDEEGNDRKGNPFLAGASGRVKFYAEEGTYSLRLGLASRTGVEAGPSVSAVVTALSSGTSAALDAVLSPIVNQAPAAWPAANMAVFQRVWIPAGTYRYLRFKIGVQNGNIQVGVVKLSGAQHQDYTRVMSSGIIACPAAGNIRQDLGATALTEGDYAIFAWADGTTVTMPTVTASAFSAAALGAEVTSLATGVLATGSFTWGQRLLPLFTLERDF